MSGFDTSSGSAPRHHRETPHELPVSGNLGKKKNTKKRQTLPEKKRKDFVLADLLHTAELEDLLLCLPADFASWREEFQAKYRPDNCADLEVFCQSVLQKAQQIKRDFPFLLENIAYFLYKNGICLLAIPQEKFSDLPTKDGFLENYQGIPFIVIAKDAKTPRRRYFTVAHEVYHALFDPPREGVGERLANQFAGAMLIRKKEICNSLQRIEIAVPIADEQIVLALRQLYTQYNISLECLINTLADYSYITQEQRKQYSGKHNAQKRRGLIASWNALEEEGIWDTRELLERFEMDDEGMLYRPIGLCKDDNWSVPADFDTPLEEILQDFLS